VAEAYINTENNLVFEGERLGAGTVPPGCLG
jgi:hypothetical protein